MHCTAIHTYTQPIVAKLIAKHGLTTAYSAAIASAAAPLMKQSTSTIVNSFVSNFASLKMSKMMQTVEAKTTEASWYVS